MITMLITYFRYVRFETARLLGRIYYWLRSEWRPPVFWLIVAAISVWLFEHLLNSKGGLPFQGWNVPPYTFLGTLLAIIVIVLAEIWSEWWKILAFYAFFWLLWWVWHARKRVVIEDFMDYTGDQTKTDTRGLATLLVVRLGQLRELYRNVNEQRAIATSVFVNNSIDATIKVEDVSEFLQDAVSAQSKFSLGPLEIPVGTLMSLIGRFVQGPRIIGSLHKDNGVVTLTAQRIGEGQPYKWRIDRSIAVVGSAEVYDLDEMVKELGCRMFTDLALSGSVRWRATSVFSEGLRAYRECLRSPKVRKLNLQEAEKKFLEALAEDQKLNLAYYNLGVVYTELELNDAAEDAFLKAINQDPGSWQAYYALAMNRYERGRKVKDDAASKRIYDSVIQLCKRVIVLKPGAANTAKAYQLQGLAYQEIGALKNAIKSFRKAINLSWKALCLAELKGKGVAEVQESAIPQLETLASVCLTNRAAAYTSQGKFHRAKALLQQALYLTHSDADYYAYYYFELGEMYYKWQKYEQAAHEYKYTTRIDPENPKYWASLALAYASAYEQQKQQSSLQSDQQLVLNQGLALEACGRVLDNASQASDEDLKKTSEAYGQLGEYYHSYRVKAMKPFLRGMGRLTEKIKQGEEAIASREEKLSPYNRAGQEWEYAQVSIALGHAYMHANQYAEAEICFREAIEKLEGNHRKEIRSQGLRALVARSLLKQGEFAFARREAEHAIALDPLSPFEHDALGDIYFELHEYEHAIAAWQDALLCQHALLTRPNTADAHLRIGIAYVRLAQHRREFTRRIAEFQQAITYLKQAYDLYTSDQREQEQKKKAGYYLGVLHFELGEYEEAISYLSISQTLGYVPLASTFYLAYAYLRNKEYDECIKQFRRLVEDAEERQERLEQGGKGINEIVEAETETQMSLGELLALAYWGQAFAYAERDVNLDEALTLLKTAQRYIDTLAQLDAKVQYPARYPHCKGWLLYKQGKTDEAIKSLEEALSLMAHAEAYLHLALAYERKWQESREVHLLLQVRIYCQHVRNLDIGKEYEQPVQELLQRLQDGGNSLSKQ